MITDGQISNSLQMISLAYYRVESSPTPLGLILVVHTVSCRCSLSPSRRFSSVRSIIWQIAKVPQAARSTGLAPTTGSRKCSTGHQQDTKNGKISECTGRNTFGKLRYYPRGFWHSNSSYSRHTCFSPVMITMQDSSRVIQWITVHYPLSYNKKQSC